MEPFTIALLVLLVLVLLGTPALGARAAWPGGILGTILVIVLAVVLLQAA